MRLDEFMSQREGPPPSVVCCEGDTKGDDSHDEDDVECHFADEDFYTSIDLLETARKQMKRVLLHGFGLGEGRTQSLTNLCDDIKQFIDEFIEAPDDTSSD